MTAFDDIAAMCAADGLGIVGAFHAGPEDGLAPQIRTLLLLGPDSAAMWQAFSAAPEASDGAAHPMDRWSRRVIGRIAGRCDGEAFFPFGGPPYHPFIRWAARGEHSAISPVAMQVSPVRGLWASFRGALALRDRIELPERPKANPCTACPRPCLEACPVAAFRDGSYDVPRCVAHVRSVEGAACRSGCLVRRACPAGAGLDLPEAERRFHMAAFLAAH